MISILILTKNEEQDLPGCLASVAWADDIHVFDSCSIDGTAPIARAFGASVTKREFDTYSGQRNAALGMLPFRHDWIFILDADERPTPELSEEMIKAVTAAQADVGGFRIWRRDFLWNTWLEHAQISRWYVRLVRKGCAHYVREVNELLEVDGGIAELQHPLDHFPFSKGFAHWVAKHNVYSTMEAELVANGAATRQASLRQALFENDFHLRRAAQKAIFFKLPFRPLLKWCYMMFWRGAILDGRAGVTYATLQSLYEFLIVLKTREIEESFQTGKIPRRLHPNLNPARTPSTDENNNAGQGYSETVDQEVLPLEAVVVGERLERFEGRAKEDQQQDTVKAGSRTGGGA
jgi:glycosyltransferase involved in cell wall biosynthesis